MVSFRTWTGHSTTSHSGGDPRGTELHHRHGKRRNSGLTPAHVVCSTISPGSNNRHPDPLSVSKGPNVRSGHSYLCGQSWHTDNCSEPTSLTLEGTVSVDLVPEGTPGHPLFFEMTKKCHTASRLMTWEGFESQEQHLYLLLTESLTRFPEHSTPHTSMKCPTTGSPQVARRTSGPEVSRRGVTLPSGKKNH